VEVVRRSADKVALVAAIATWWFLLRSRTGVVDAVDTISYLVMVHSVWRTVRSLVHKGRSGEIAMRRREDVKTDKDERATAGPGTT
jgi:hypothetical protein